MNKAIIERRLVDNPMLTDGLEDYQNKTRGYANRFVEVEGNALTRIGALAFVRRREKHHERAAEMFKSLYEARYGSGNPAMDPGRVQVDTSPLAHDSGMASKIDRTNRIKEAEKSLGKAAFDRLVAVLVLCAPAGEGLSSRPRQRAIDQVLGDLDDLSKLWGLSPRAA